MESDEELIECASKGDTDAFETLYRRYRDWVYRLAWRYTGDRDLALDVIQETFTYLLKKLPELKLTVRITTLLYPVVKHISLTALRKTRRLLSPRRCTACLCHNYVPLLLVTRIGSKPFSDVANALHLQKWFDIQGGQRYNAVSI